MPDLWEKQKNADQRAHEPLASRMRPRTIDQFVGQQHILAPGKLLRRMLDADRLTSVLFYGPPGVGKTALAQVIAHATKRHFERANAAGVGVAEIRRILDDARKRTDRSNQQTTLFLDEIHRFNRAQQDILLEDVERGTVTLIGATTENPFFSINSPLVSRSQIFQFESLTEPDILTILRTAIHDPDRGYGQLNLNVHDDALAHWARTCDGDARRALTALEIAVLSNTDPKTPIDLDTAQQSIQRKAVVYDGTGDEHYDAASALIKSMRGSDPDAAIYWLAKMIEAGEDPRFIARRIAILASEDIGNADPNAINVAASAYIITERIGMPEAQLTLAQAVTYMATAPKSNAATTAIAAATKDVKEARTIPVPKHLRDAHYHGAKNLGHGTDYQYAHNSPTGHVDQDYLGVDKTYYSPSPRGYEIQIKKYLDSLHPPPNPYR